MNTINLKLGNVTDKKISTPNDFVSHMIEHIAWRYGCGIELSWKSEDWYELGQAIGKGIKGITNIKIETIKDVVGMSAIDDGTAKARISYSTNPKVKLSASKNVDLDLLKSSRCEQINNSKPLEDLLKGLADSLKIEIDIVVLNFKDQHHTWEGVFRTIGICLQKALNPIKKSIDLSEINSIEKNVSSGDISVIERSLTNAKIRRGTAESGVTVNVDFLGDPSESTCEIICGDSIQESVKNIEKIFKIIAESIGVKLDIRFKAKVLSSSHVVFEDIGLVLGRALIEILKLRFEETGAMGAGSSISTLEDFKKQEGSVMVSVEGRKFWDFIALNGDEKKLYRDLIIGQNVFGSLKSEDLDDFIDGLSGGLTSSIIIHIDNIKDPEELWKNIFTNLGKALKEVFEINETRKGVPPGVKATLS
ncbi:hypothetical protein JXB41_03055 [Candidatus Woesearchaeota archaeon]|nr:hypothetical protein [Candidatus Woesearchaeota archaeon]